MKYMYKTMLISFLTNIFLVTTKLITGIIAGSRSLVADAIHSFSDLSTDVVAIVGEKLSTSDADKEHPYGHGRIEYITSIIIGTAIMILGIGLINNVIRSKSSVPNNNIYIIGIVAITVIVKYILATYIMRQGEKYHNVILNASGKESMSTVFSALSVLLTILLSSLTKYNHLFIYADKLGGIIVGIFILRAAFAILRDNINAILGESEQNHSIINEISAIINSINGVKDVDSMILTKYGSYYRATVQVSINADYSLEQAHEIAHEIEDTLLNDKHSIKYVIVHINPYEKRY